MLEVTSAAVETQLGVDFACIYKESSLSKWVYVGTCFFFFLLLVVPVVPMILYGEQYTSDSYWFFCNNTIVYSYKL